MYFPRRWKCALIITSQDVSTANMPWKYLWWGLGVPSVRILYRWSGRCTMECLLEGVWCAVVLEYLVMGFRSLGGMKLSGRKSSVHLEIFIEKEYFYKK